jgi:hypothetical protein
MDKVLTEEQLRVLDGMKKFGGSSKTISLAHHDDSQVFDELEKLGLIRRIPNEGGSEGAYYEIIDQNSTD